VRGTSQAVVIEAQNATVEEVLVALTDTFKVQFRSAANLDKRLTGTYEGTLQQAVSRILKGYDFVVKSSEARLEITLLGAGKPAAIVGTPPAPKSAGAAPAVGLALNAAADNTGHPAPMPNSVKVAEGAVPTLRPSAEGPVPTPRPSGSGPMPQVGPSVGSGPMPSPMPPQSLVPPPPTASSAAPPPMPSTSAPASSPPVSSPTR
jgi:hypothetical protein